MSIGLQKQTKFKSIINLIFWQKQKFSTTESLPIRRLVIFSAKPAGTRALYIYHLSGSNWAQNISRVCGKVHVKFSNVLSNRSCSMIGNI